MVIVGPLVTLAAASSCLGTILSGNVFACLTDIVPFVLGGILFVVGITIAIIGVIVPDPIPAPLMSPPMGSVAVQPGVQVICKKCEHGYDSSRFFCPSCGQRQG
jgi:hypothetical protein